MHRKRKNQPQSSAFSVLMGCFVICFGIFWTVTALRMAPFMAIFGVFFIAAAVFTTVNSIKTVKNKMNEPENDDEKTKFSRPAPPQELRCPYCGAPIHENDDKCEYCGSRI